ncbi:hypothetical protein BBO99_00003141 [Phytophthora kernoviae]|uniref:Uncharacterized protein n=2 Tax=Phytophthora kernoviae TaxID=325452 RepID=A0A3R7GGR3_9STRA|nr:hypothetical protein G195_003434 [Phytophthora kernoviae 00238/432]KAG2528468.1 hypothetical protein JM16_002799 [Phytophthora kernoviae]RLM95354.1 hypothetical protein BBI17_003146 [Phytophthora kernoviae]RLN82127.1 hypothetical protein BBO99_00003141 [Phytophthora kernoviae]
MLAHETIKTANMFSTLTKTSSLGGSTTSTASASGSGTPTSSTSGASKKKRSKKKKSKSKMDEEEEEEEEEGNSHDGDAENYSARANNIVKEGENLSQLPLAQRLEVAAAIPDTHAALVGLLGWSRLYVHTDTILTFFQSDALPLLLTNVLRARPPTAVFDNLEALLANCLSVEASSDSTEAPHREMAVGVVAAVRAIADQLRGDGEDMADINAEAERASRALSRLVCTHALSLHGVDAGSPPTQVVQVLEAKISEVTRADEAVRGQTIRESFQRRDLRSDALTLHDERLKTLSQLVEERVRSSEEQNQVDDVEEEAEKEGQSSDELAQTEEDETAMKEVTQSLQDMQNSKDAKLAPLRKKKAEAGTEAQTLRQQKEELEAQLRTVQSELQRVIGEQHQADEDMRVVEERFIADTARFRAEHQHVTRRFSRAQRRRVISTEVARVSNDVRQARLAQSQVHALRAKQTACVAQQLEASLNYFECELPCVKFMMSRVEENETQLAPMRSEAVRYRVLGVSAVAEELEKKADELEMHLEEDRNCLSALRKRDEEVLDDMRHLLTNPALCEAVADVDEKVKHESQRMIDYVSQLYDLQASDKPPTQCNDSSALSNGSASPKKT